MARLLNMLLVTSFVALILFYTVESFTPTQRVARVSPYNIGHNIIQLHAAEDDSNGSSLPPLPSQKGAVPKVEEDADAAVKRMREDWSQPTSSSTEVAEEEEEGTSYPIDLPSPVLLGLSMVLAISSIGKYRYMAIYYYVY